MRNHGDVRGGALTLVLIDLLKRRGRDPLHAAAMSPPGGAVVLFPGGSGARKTTLALALLHEAWGFLADDMVFLSPRADGPTVFGFADEIDVTDDTVAMFAVVAAVPCWRLGTGRHLPRLARRIGDMARV